MAGLHASSADEAVSKRDRHGLICQYARSTIKLRQTFSPLQGMSPYECPVCIGGYTDCMRKLKDIGEAEQRCCATCAVF